MTGNGPQRLVSLIDALRWGHSCTSLAAEWRSAYVDLLEQRFAGLGEADASGLLLQALEIMSRQELEDVVLSPRISWRLFRGKTATTVSALQAEILRQLNEYEAGSEDDRERLESGCARLADIVVDSRSDYNCPGRERDEPALAPLNTDIEAGVLAGVEDAMARLKHRLPAISAFVSQMTTRLVLRTDPRHPANFASGSFRDHAGVTLIVNSQAIDNNPFKLIDAIVHEAVHASIYMYEPLAEPLCNTHPDHVRVRSCWSGRSLTLDQFVQACFVWWGLMNLWQRWLREDRQNEEAGSLFNRASAGFGLRPVSMLRKEIDRSFLHDHTWAALSEIEANAVRRLNFS